jgi:gamma-glutamylcyclotransferase (GGCT)/AIG2-like uncharacterized protein YtfP
MNHKLVFVYGTLRRNEGNHEGFLSDAKLVAEQCWTYGQLYDTGYGFPALIAGDGRVYGECYSVSDDELQALDRLEGYRGAGQDNHYDRVQQTIFTDSGSLKAYLYTYPIDKVKQDQQILSGDCKIHRYFQDLSSLVYFAYGSCMDDQRFRNQGVDGWFQDVLGRGVISGYELQFTRKASDGYGRADLVETGEGAVEGKLYRIGEEALHYLYGREGVNSGCYRPAFIDIEWNDQELKDVLTFVVVDKEEETEPPLHYVEEIIRGGKEIGSVEYIHRLIVEIQVKFNLSVSHLMDS